jgi:hypothetical protein
VYKRQVLALFPPGASLPEGAITVRPAAGARLARTRVC